MAARYRGARLAGQERPLHRVPGRQPRRLGPGLQGRRAPADAGRHQARSGGAARRRCRPRRPARRSRACAGKSVPRQHPHLYVYGTNGPPDAVAAARALADALADWGPMVAAKFTVKARPRGDRRRSGALRPGAGRRGAVQQARGRGRRADARRAPARRSGFRADRPRPARPRASSRWCSAPRRRAGSRACSASPATTATPGRPRATAPSRCSTTEVRRHDGEL